MGDVKRPIFSQEPGKVIRVPGPDDPQLRLTWAREGAAQCPQESPEESPYNTDSRLEGWVSAGDLLLQLVLR